MPALLLALSLLAPGDPTGLPLARPVKPHLTIRGDDVTGILYHAEQGMGFSPNWVQLCVSRDCQILRWEVWTVKPVRGLDALLLVETGDNWCSVCSWWGKCLRVRATVRTLTGRKVLETQVVFDKAPE